MVRLVLVTCLGWLLVGTGRAQGHASVDKIDLESVYKCSWDHAYCATQTQGAEAHLRKQIESGKCEYQVAARALLYIMDGKSEKDFLKKQLSELPAKLEKLKKRLAGKKIEPLAYRAFIRKLRTNDGFVAAAALLHHGDRQALELVLRVIGFGAAPNATPRQRSWQLNGHMVLMFRWQNQVGDDVIKYLVSEDIELRRGALAVLTRSYIQGTPPVKHSYDPSRTPAQNAKAIGTVKRHYLRNRPGLNKRRIRRLEEVALREKRNKEEAVARLSLKQLKAAYKKATGEEKKRLALQLDGLDHIDPTREFGYDYPGKPLDKKLAHRKTGISLYIRKMGHIVSSIRALPPERVAADLEKYSRLRMRCQMASLRAKLGMEDEKEAVEEGWAFLVHVDSVLDGRSREDMATDEIVWNFCGISYEFNRIRKATTLAQYLDYTGLPTFWKEHDRFDQHPKEMAVLTKRWSEYMSRNRKLSDHVTKHLFSDIYELRTKALLKKQQGEDTRVKVLREMRQAVAAQSPTVTREALLHIQEMADYIAARRAETLALPKKHKGKDVFKMVSKYVLWNAMANAENFTDYIYLNEIRWRSWHLGYWPEWYPKHLSKKLAAEYDKQEALLLQNYPELARWKPLRNGEKRKPWKRR